MADQQQSELPQGKGEGPQPTENHHTSDHLANERTFLAWIRTSIAVISLGFVIARFSLWLTELSLSSGAHIQIRRTGLSLPIGLGMVGFGALLTLLAAYRFEAINRAIGPRGGLFRAGPDPDPDRRHGCPGGYPDGLFDCGGGDGIVGVCKLTHRSCVPLSLTLRSSPGARTALPSVLLGGGGQGEGRRKKSFNTAYLLSGWGISL